MAAAVTVDTDIAIGQTKHLYEVSIAADDSYPSGGYVLGAEGVSSFSRLVAQSSGGYVFEFVKSSQKLKVLQQTDPADAGGADVPLVEVAAATDLSALTAIEAIAIGA